VKIDGDYGAKLLLASKREVVATVYVSSY